MGAGSKISGRHLAVLLVAAGMNASSLGAGTNMLGLFISPLSEALATGRGEVSLAVSIFGLSSAVGGMCAGRLIRSSRIFWMLRAAAVLTVVSTLACGVVGSLPVLYVLSALRGALSGFVGLVVASTLVNNWFFSSVGLATSLYMASSGVVGALLSPAVSMALERGGLWAGYALCAAAVAVCDAPLFLPNIALRPQDVGAKPLGDTSASGAAVSAGREDAGPHPHAMALALAFGLSLSVVSSFVTHLPGLADTYGHAATVGALMLSACMVVNTVGKVAFGALTDRVGPKRANLVWQALVAVSVALMLTGSVGALIAGAGMFGLMYSLVTVGTVMLCRRLFGDGAYTSGYARVNLATALGGAIAGAAMGFLFDASGSYVLSLVLVGCAVVVSAVASWTAYAESKSA